MTTLLLIAIAFALGFWLGGIDERCKQEEQFVEYGCPCTRDPIEDR